MSTPRGARVRASRQLAARERVPRCEFTRLTKPECHCPSCLATLVATHAPGSSAMLLPTAITPSAAIEQASSLEAA